MCCITTTITVIIIIIYGCIIIVCIIYGCIIDCNILILMQTLLPISNVGRSSNQSDLCGCDLLVSLVHGMSILCELYSREHPHWNTQHTHYQVQY